MPRTYSAEYKRLQPYIIEEIRKVVTALGLAGSSSGSGTVARHGIASDRHTGELAQTQAPWAATKVELSNHAALPDVHHAKLHGITDAANHSATGSQYQIVGLTSVNTLGLLTPASSPTANQVVKTDGTSAVTLVDLTVTSDLFVTGYLDFGTDVIYEDASYLQVTGSKAVRFGQNIGNANWTVYNAGGASFGGSVDIVSGGDLNVGNSVLIVDNSANSVGIGGVPIPAPLNWPDPQFALDINGPARATYWIGPHAIQLKNVLLLSHFDGRYPYETNLSGEPNGHMGQVATVSGGLVYRPGKFYKAAQIAGACTNLITNPRFGNASYLTGWTQRNSPTVIAGTEAYIGSTAAWVQSSGSGSIYYKLSSLTNGTTYTATVYAKYGTPTVYLCDNSFANAANATWTDVGGGWYRAVATRAVTDTYMVLVLPGTSSGVNYSNAQIEQRAFPTPYCDGAMGDGHAWTGTAHASTSTRTATTLSYPTSGNLNASAGTVMAWVWVDGNDSGTNAEGIIDAGTSWPYFALYMSAGTTPSLVLGGASGTQGASGPAASVRQWVHVAATWTGSTMTVYTNGVAGTPVAYTYAPTLQTSIRVGYLATLGNRQLNGFIDDLCILDRAASADEIRAVYESNAPVFAESSLYVFRATPKGLINGDDEGLWMRDTAGKPVLGVYGGEAATKNWGGFDLVAGDLLLGNNAVGSSAIWWSRVSGKFGFYGAGSGTPQVEIATDGSLTAGAGKVKLSVDGLTAYNASNAATIYVDANGISTGDGGGRTTVGTWTSGSRIKWYTVGELFAATPESYLDDSSISRTLYPLVMRAIRQGNDAGLVEISAVNTSNVGAFIRVGEGFRLKDYYGTPYNTNRVVHASATDIILEATNLQLRSLTTSGAAVGAYSGKIRINIAGTNYYIPYYAS